MNLHLDAPDAAISAAFRQLFGESLKMPPAGSEISDIDLRRALRVADGSGRTIRVEAEGRAWTVSTTVHGPRLWMGGNWNTDPPTLEGAAYLDAARRAFGLIRRDDGSAEAITGFPGPVPTPTVDAGEQPGLFG